MSGVYNRKLFRQSNSRNAFQGMGGIMSSSNELMQQAMQTANNAPMPSDLGPLQLKPQSAMPQPQAEQPEAIPYDPSQAGMLPPDQGMPAEPAPPDPMGQMQGQAPMDPMQQQPMGAPPEQAPPQELAPMQDAPFMPPGTPPSVAGYQDGGTVGTGTGARGAAFDGLAGGVMQMLGLGPTVAGMAAQGDATPYVGRSGRAPNAMANEARRILGSQEDAPAPSSGLIDIGVTAGTVETPQLTGIEMFNIAEQILPSLGVLPPETVATNIVTEAEKNGVPFSGDLRADIESLYSELTGDPEATNKSIDDLNRGILGAAIAAGKSPRATENIANGMLVGLQAMKDTAEKRAAVAAQAQYGLLTAALAPKTSGNTGIADDYSASRTWRESYDGIMKQDYNSLDIPTREDGTEMSQLEYANMVADLAVIGSKSPEDLVGTKYEGLHEKYANPDPAAAAAAAAAAAPVAPAAPAAAPVARTAEEEAKILEQARKNVPSKGKEAVQKMLEQMGIDPGKL